MEKLETYFGIVEDISNLIKEVFLSTNQNISITDFISFVPLIIRLVGSYPNLRQILGLNTPTIHWLYDSGDVLINSLLKFTFPLTRNAAIHQLETAAEKNPNSMLLLMLGIIQMVQSDMESANQFFWKATKASSMISGARRQAHIWAIWTDAFLLQEKAELDNSDQSDSVIRLQKNIHWLINKSDLNSSERQKVIPMVIMSIIISKVSLDSGRFLLADWQTKEPDNLTPVQLLAKLELRAGNYATAIKTADRILTQQPDNQDIQQVKKTAIEEMEKTLKSISSPPK